MYFSVLSKEELADIPKNQREQYIGIIECGVILQPLRCYECEDLVAILDEDSRFAQCPSCGVMYEVHYYNSPNPFFNKEIECDWDGLKFDGGK